MYQISKPKRVDPKTITARNRNKLSVSIQVIHHQSSKHEAKDGRDMGRGAVDLGFRGAPFVIDEVGIASSDDGLGTHAGISATGGFSTFVRQHLGREHTKELFLRIGFRFSETLAHHAGQGTALHLPKLRHLYLGRIHFERSTHGREKLARAFGGVQNKVYLVLETVNGVDDVVVGLELELLGVLGGINLLHRIDLSLWIDLQKAFLQHLHLDHSHCFGGGLQLPVDIGDTHAVAVHDGEVTDAASHQTLGAPTAHAPHAEDDDALIHDTLHRLLAQKQVQTVEYGVLCTHNRIIEAAKIVVLGELSLFAI